MADKRVSKRKIKRLPIIFSDGSTEHTGTSSDFSPTGLFIRTRHTLNPGAHLRMTLQLDDGCEMVLTGIIVRAIKTGVLDFKNGMGIKLTSMSQEYGEFVKALSYNR